jgi:hypothetical protein
MSKCWRVSLIIYMKFFSFFFTIIFIRFSCNVLTPTYATCWWYVFIKYLIFEKEKKKFFLLNKFVGF